MKRQNTNKILALLICSFLFVTYLEEVWLPFVHEKRAENKAQNLKATPLSNTPAAISQEVVGEKKVKEEQIPAETENKIQADPQDQAIDNIGLVIIETPLTEVTLSLLGGRIKDFILKEYREKVAAESPNLNMIEHASGQALPIGIYQGEISDAEVQYRLISAPHLSSRSNPPVYQVDSANTEFVLEGTFPDGSSIKKVFVFDPTGYFVNFRVEKEKLKNQNTPLEIEWTKRVTDKSPSLLNPYATGEFVWFDGTKAKREQFPQFEKEATKAKEQNPANNGKEYEKDLEAVQWLTMGDVYFMATMVSVDGSATGRLIKTPELYRMRLKLSAENHSLGFFVGPKKIDILDKAPFQLSKNINVGITGFISVPMMHLLRFLYLLFGNYGLAIIAFGLIAKFALTPLTVSSYKQMKAMQQLQPEMKRIKEQIKDKQQQQVQLMELYKKKGVNPVGGCIPALIQLPIFIGLYSALQLSFELRHANFALWINDLSSKEALIIAGHGVPVMVVIFIVTTMVQLWLQPTGDDPTQQMQRKVMMVVLPVMFGFMFASLPAGLTLYFLTNNILGIAQQKALNKGSNATVIKVTIIASALTMLLGYVLTKL